MDAVTGKVDVGWEGIKMVLKQKKKGDNKAERIILDGSLKGVAKAGRLTAVMGPSGSGKSTFLHALAGRIKEDPKISLSGKRYVDGEEVAGDSQLLAAFIEQEVNFFPHMTVKETLDFRVDLKLGKKLSKSERDEVVSSLMDQLGLTKSANTIVGNAKIRGLSGGERKRLSIACELITGAPIVMLDEPTRYDEIHICCEKRIRFPSLQFIYFRLVFSKTYVFVSPYSSLNPPLSCAVGSILIRQRRLSKPSGNWPTPARLLFRSFTNRPSMSLVSLMIWSSSARAR